MAGKLIIACFVAALSAALIVVALGSPPTTADLDVDISELTGKIADAKVRSNGFTGGLIKSLVDVRVEILSATKVMLEAKRASVLRRINLSFQINGSEFKSSRNLSEIEADIEAARKRAVSAEAEASRYTGGLLQVLQLSKAAAEEVSIAQLRSAYFSAKYGIPSIGVFMSQQNRSDDVRAPANKIVNDKDAL